MSATQASLPRSEPQGRASDSGTRFAAGRCLVFCLTIFLSQPGMSAAANRQLNVLAWSEYFSRELLDEFERRHDVEVVLTHFTSDEHRDSLMADSGAHGYDLIMIDGNQIARYADHGWLMPIDHATLANFHHIDQHWQRAYPAADDFAVATTWGILGIAYRKDKIPEGIDAWSQLVSPAETLRGRIYMNNSVREAVSIGLKASGASDYTLSLEPILATGERLLQQKPFVRFYSYPALAQDSMLYTGEVWAGPIYNGDALVMQALDPRIEFIVPKEGAILRSAYFALPAYVRESELAMRFIDFFSDPEIAAAQASHSRFATPNRAARALLPDSLLDNPLIYPDTSNTADAEYFATIAPPLQRQINHIGALLWFQ